jgi:hypothetical protein
VTYFPPRAAALRGKYSILVVVLEFVGITFTIPAFIGFAGVTISGAEPVFFGLAAVIALRLRHAF